MLAKSSPDFSNYDQFSSAHAPSMRGMAVLSHDHVRDVFRKIPDFVHQHVHLGSLVPNIVQHQEAQRRCIANVPMDFHKWVEHCLAYPGKNRDLDSYLQHYHTAERIQSGAKLQASMFQALYHHYNAQGRSIFPGHGQVELLHFGGNEIRFNTFKRNENGFYDSDAIMQKAADGIRDFEKRVPGIQIGLIICFARDFKRKSNLKLAEKVADWARDPENRIIGIDLAGPEKSNNLASQSSMRFMKRVFDQAGPRLKRDLHLGETAHTSMDTFVSAIETLQPHGVAHPWTAVRAWHERQDDRGLRALQQVERIEICFYSNWATGIFSDPRDFRKFIDVLFSDRFNLADKITFSADGPNTHGQHPLLRHFIPRNEAAEGVTLADELAFGLLVGAIQPEQLIQAAKNSVRTTFIPDYTARKLAAGDAGRSS